MNLNKNNRCFVFFYIVLLTLGLQTAKAQSSAKVIVVPLDDGFAVIPTNVDSTASGGGWGASGLSASSRPDRSWIASFNNSTPITGIGSQAELQNAIDDCVDYCVIEIDDITLSGTIYINQSKVKLLGKPGNEINYTGNDSIFLIETGASEIVIEALIIDGQDTPRNSKDVYGIVAEGELISNVLIKGNTIRNLVSEENGHGIAIFGSGNSEATAIQDVIIEQNTLDDLRTGSSESIVVNGNVKQWEIKNNSVTNVNNIAIDAIGGEGTSPTRIVAGRVLPGLFDVAREGFIEGNVVDTMSTLDNSQYGNSHSWAGGIYVDGGRDIVIDGNIMIDTPWGIEVGAENCVSTSNITVTNNVVSGSYFGDLLIGGYSADGFLEEPSINCNPLTTSDDNEGHGYVENATVKSNTFATPSPSVSKLELQLRIRQSVIIELGISADNSDGNVSGDQNSIRITQ